MAGLARDVLNAGSPVRLPISDFRLQLSISAPTSLFERLNAQSQPATTMPKALFRASQLRAPRFLLPAACLPAKSSQLAPERFCLLVVITLITIYTLAPFEFSGSLADLLGRMSLALQFSSADTGIKLLGHFVAFFILGALVAVAHQRTLTRHGLVRWALAAVVFCAGLEFTQLLQSSRHARLTDLLCNIAAVLAGAALLRWPGLRVFRSILTERLRRHVFQVQAGTLILGIGIWLAAGLYPIPRLSKLNWSADFPLVVGSELDHEGPWLGEIRYIGIYGRALTGEQIQRTTDTTRGNDRKSDLLVGYDFAESHGPLLWPQGSLQSANLSIELPKAPDRLANGEGIALRHPSLLTTRGPASGLTEAIELLNAFSVEAWVRPFGIDQSVGEPARIVSVSEGIWQRNFTLGQEEGDLIFRVRNGINGPNGLTHALRLKSVVQDSLQRFIAVYDHGVSTIFRDNQLLKPVLDLREPNIYLSLGPTSIGHAAAGVLLVLVIALPVYSILSFIQDNRFRHFVTISATFLIGSLPYAVSCLLVGGPWRVGLFLWLAAALLAVYPLSFAYVFGGNAEKTKR